MPNRRPPPTRTRCRARSHRLLLVKINEVAAETGLTTRTIRYYEEIGILKPAARSEGDYRLYDDSDVQRIRHIRELRDVAGFSLAEVAQMLEDEAVRARNRAAFHATDDVAVRRALVLENLERADRTASTLREKLELLSGMVREVDERRARMRERLVSLANPHEEAGA